MSDHPDRAEVVVVGAGMGGLACAARLARAGVKTLLVEQDRRVGGTAHGFSRQGYSFPTGPVGVTVPDFIDAALRSCGAESVPEWTRSHFRLITDGLNVVLSQPLRDLASDLARLFPAEREGLERMSRDLLASIRNLETGDVPDGNSPPGISAEAHVRRFLSDERLVRLFASQGAEPPSASWPVMVRMWDFLSETGIWYPSCGLHGLPLLLEDAFLRHGGHLITGRAIRRILVEKGRTKGVLLEDGAQVQSPVVVSNADYLDTIGRLLPPDSLPRTFRRTVEAKPLSGTILSVSLGLRRPAVPTGGWPEPNLLYCARLPGVADSWLERREQPPSFDADEVWIHRPSLQDPALAPPGKEVIVLRVNAAYETFKPYRGRKGAHAGAYYETKAALGRALVARASDLFPRLAESIEYMDVATPLTYEFWGHRTRGSVAGWAWNDMALEDLSNPPVEGLFLVGICGYSHLFRGGMGTSIHSGLEAASRILSEHPPVS